MDKSMMITVIGSLATLLGTVGLWFIKQILVKLEATTVLQNSLVTDGKLVKSEVHEIKKKVEVHEIRIDKNEKNIDTIRVTHNNIACGKNHPIDF